MKTKRFWEIDALRGIAIIMMVIYHIVWALDASGLIVFPAVRHGLWRGFAVLIATTFIFLVGVSLNLSYSRIKNKKVKPLKKYLIRGLKIFGYALLITLFSFLIFKEQFIYFGILHFISFAIIIAIPFLNMKNKNLLFGLIAIGIGLLLRNIWLNFPWLVIFGLKFRGINTIDYFPIFPWIGVVLIGLFVGTKLYPNGKRKFNIPEKVPFKEILSFLGKHSLMIYFLHAIIIFSIIFIITHI